MRILPRNGAGPASSSTSEIAVRKSILDAMQKQDIKDYISVASLFHAYHINARNVLANIGDLRKVIQ